MKAYFADALIVKREPIADAGFGEDMDRAFGIAFDLLAQRANVNAQILHIGFAAPNLAEDETVRQDLARMGDEQAQNVIFAG